MCGERVTLGSYARRVRERELQVRLQLSELRALAATSSAFVRDRDSKDLLATVARRLGEIEAQMGRWTHEDGRP